MILNAILGHSGCGGGALMLHATHQSHVSATALRPLRGEVLRAARTDAVGQMAQPRCGAHGHDKIHLCHATEMGAETGPFKPTRASRLRENLHHFSRSFAVIEHGPVTHASRVAFEFAFGLVLAMFGKVEVMSQQNGFLAPFVERDTDTDDHKADQNIRNNLHAFKVNLQRMEFKGVQTC